MNEWTHEKKKLFISNAPDWSFTTRRVPNKLQSCCSSVPETNLHIKLLVSEWRLKDLKGFGDEWWVVEGSRSYFKTPKTSLDGWPCLKRKKKSTFVLLHSFCTFWTDVLNHMALTQNREWERVWGRRQRTSCNTWNTVAPKNLPFTIWLKAEAVIKEVLCKRRRRTTTAAVGTPNEQLDDTTKSVSYKGDRRQRAERKF